MKKYVLLFFIILVIISFSACTAKNSGKKRIDNNNLSTTIVQQTEKSSNTIIETQNKKDKTSNNKNKLVHVYVESNGARTDINDIEKIDEQIEHICAKSAETSIKMKSKVATFYKEYSNGNKEIIIEAFLGSDNCYYLKASVQKNDNKYYKIEPSDKEDIFNFKE